jgi:two-component system, chemotaxis family, CheB/CheR fusion protein
LRTFAPPGALALKTLISFFMDSPTEFPLPTPPVSEGALAQSGLFVLGVGASAGGLEALSDFLSHLPPMVDNIAIVVVQHLSPTYKSMLVQLLSKQTPLQVIEVKNEMPIEAGKVYITPPDSEIGIENGVLRLSKPLVSIGPKPSVDSFFHSLAKEKGSHAVGIILSGTGSDGAKGIRRIKELGGFTVAQDPQTAKYDGMPVSAIETGQVDLVLPPDKMGEELFALISDPENARPLSPLPEIKTDSLHQVFALLSRRTGTDFGQYKPTTILRRLEKRLDALRIESLDQYLQYIEGHPDEVETLFKTILIGVTSFFRDTEAFQELEKFLAKIISSKVMGDTVRIWAPGCASGEEAYSLAILLSKLLGSRLADYQIQIFATDIDDRAIAFARRGVYPESAMTHVPPEITAQYFVREGGDFKLSKLVRSMVMFSKHDVTNNPPFVKLDMICCRNLLIYFSTPLQKHVIPLFHYSLNPNGLLFLGRSENIGQFSDLFITMDSRNKIFQRRNASSLPLVRFSPFSARPRNLAAVEPLPAEMPGLTIPELIRETLYTTFEWPYVIVNGNMDVLQVSGDVRMYLGLTQGSMNANIVKMAQGELQLDLRTTISRAIKDSLPAASAIKHFQFFGKDIFVRIVVKPMFSPRNQEGLFMVVFEQKEPNTALPLSAEKAKFSENERVIELEQELAAIKEQLQAFIEELETSNEELQSLNEELQSANEELQSGNEELETTNEELQSTNEEMQIAYAELRTTNETLERQEKRLQESEKNTRALLNNTLQSSLLIDQHYKILAFNKVAADKTWAVVGREMKEGTPVIDYLLPSELEDFQQNFQKSLLGQQLSGERSLTVPASGQVYWFRYHFYPVLNPDGQVEVVSYNMLDISDERRAQAQHQQNELLIRALFDNLDMGVSITDQNGLYVSVNPAYCLLVGYEAGELLGQSHLLTAPPEFQAEAQQRFARALGGERVADEWYLRRKDGSVLRVRKTKSRLQQADGKPYVVTLVRDATNEVQWPTSQNP